MAIEVSLLVWNWSKQSGSRLLLLVAIADYANAEGIAWPSIRSLCKRTRMGERYVQKMLRQIETDGELQTIKRTNTSNVYRVTIRKPATVQFEGELPFAPEANRSSGEGRTPVPKGGELEFTQSVREPTKEPQPVKTKEDEVSIEAQRFVEWFLLLLETTGAKVTAPTAPVRANWALCYDRMIRLDCRTKEQIERVCTWARTDRFWSGNFMSPMKLRDKKDGVSYFDRFLAKITSDANAPKTNGRHFENSGSYAGITDK